MSDAIREAVSAILLNAANYPDNAVAGIWGSDMGPLIEQVTASVASITPEAPQVTEAEVEAGAKPVTQHLYWNYSLWDEADESDRETARKISREVLEAAREARNA